MPVPAIQQERILQHAWHLKKNGYKESTITGRVKLLRSFARRVDLFDPEGVKRAIALRWAKGDAILRLPLLQQTI
jgi:hypothetical protein